MRTSPHYPPELDQRVQDIMDHLCAHDDPDDLPDDLVNECFQMAATYGPSGVFAVMCGLVFRALRRIEEIDAALHAAVADRLDPWERQRRIGTALLRPPSDASDEIVELATHLHNRDQDAFMNGAADIISGKNDNRIMVIIEALAWVSAASRRARLLRANLMAEETTDGP